MLILLIPFTLLIMKNFDLIKIYKDLNCKDLQPSKDCNNFHYSSFTQKCMPNNNQNFKQQIIIYIADFQEICFEISVMSSDGTITGNAGESLYINM